jgi:hypothetical protein
MMRKGATEPNCLGGGGTVGIACLVAGSPGISSRGIQFPEIPRHFMQMGPKDWAKGWRKELPKYRLGNGVKHT